MKGPRSLRRDLALGIGCGILTLWLLAMAVAWIVLRSEMDEIYDAALQRTADWILQLPTDQRREMARMPEKSEAMSYMLRAEDGSVLMQSDGADPTVFGEKPQLGFREQADHRIAGRPGEGGTILELADPLAERREATREALATLLLPAAALAPIIPFGVAWFVSARLAPVERLAEQVAGRDSGALQPLSIPGLQAELIPIREAVNRLMGRLADALAAERAFSANAAHELRTPIAATLAQTQRMIALAPEGELRAQAEAIALELKRMARLSEKLLDLARAEAAGVAAGAGQDLRPILSLVAGDFAAADVRLELSSTPVVAAMDPDAFAILARNLIENAVSHGKPPVEVALSANGELQVTNSGPRLPADSLARMTHRFERLGSRRDGSGLGLAIVEALVRNAGAHLELRSPAPGRADGLAAIVALPAPRPDVASA